MVFFSRRLALPVLTLLFIGLGGCAPHFIPAVPAGITLQPGQYLTASYRAPGFEAAQVVYSLTPFTVTDAQGVAPDNFQAILQAELARAWQANGLKLAPRGEAVLTGTVQQISLGGGSVRFLLGRIWCDLTVSGAISRGDETLFAFQDRVHLSSPVNPGPPAPKEADLLLKDVARIFVNHLLSEILLYWPEAEGK